MTKKFQCICADPPWSFSDSLSMSDTPRGASANYQLMKNSDIIALPVKDYADPQGCILALWVPGSLLQEGMDTMKSWGFEQKQVYVWVKIKKNPLEEIAKHVSTVYKKGKTKFEELGEKGWKEYLNSSVEMLNIINPEKGKEFVQDMLAFGMGRLFRQTHEICLIGTNNNAIYKKLQNKSQRSVSFAENLKHSAKPEHLQNSLDLMFPTAEKLELFARRIRPGWTCLGNEICNGEDIRDSLKKLV